VAKWHRRRWIISDYLGEDIDFVLSARQGRPRLVAHLASELPPLTIDEAQAACEMAYRPLLIVDDVTLQPLDAVATSDFYDLRVERHRRPATVFTSNRDPSEWLAVMADPLLVQSAIDRIRARRGSS